MLPAIPSILRGRIVFVIRKPLNIRPLLGVLSLLLLSTSAAAAQGRRHVLLLYGSEKDLPMNVVVDSRLRSTIREKLGDGVELYSEHLDDSRFPDEGQPRKLLEFLRDKFSREELDLIVVVEVLDFLDSVQAHRDWFFPATPLVFCCVTERAEHKARTMQPGVTGIPANLDYGPTLEAALRLHPDTRRVVVVAGASKNDADTLADVNRDFLPYEAKVEFRYLVGLPMADLRQEVSRLSGDTIIIYLSISQDGAGKFFIPRDALVQVAQAANVPIYGYYDSYLGHGIVGGFLASFEIEAANAARLGLRILAGEKLEAMSSAGTTSCAYMFDWRRNEHRLGAQRRKPSARQCSPFSGAECLGPLPVAGDRRFLPFRVQPGGTDRRSLDPEGRKDARADKEGRKRAEDEVRESEARFRLMADRAPVLIWASGLDKGCTYFNGPWLEFTGRPLEQELGDGWAEGVHGDDLSRCLEVYNTHFDARRPFEMEYRLRRHDRAFRWVLDRGTPRFTPGGEFAGYIGACIDVTERKLALEELRVSREQQRDLASRLLRAQEVERRRLAREMHDDLTQRLAVMAIELGKLEQAAATSQARWRSRSTRPATNWSSYPRTCTLCRASSTPRSSTTSAWRMRCAPSASCFSKREGIGRQLSGRLRTGWPAQGRGPGPVPHRSGGVTQRRPPCWSRPCGCFSDRARWGGSADRHRHGQGVRPERRAPAAGFGAGQHGGTCPSDRSRAVDRVAPGQGNDHQCAGAARGEGAMNRPRVLIADDHQIVAEGLRGILEPEFELVGIVSDGREALAAALLALQPRRGRDGHYHAHAQRHRGGAAACGRRARA